MNLPCHQPQSIYRYRSYLQHVLPPLHSSLLQGGLLAGRACRVENTLSAAKVSHQVSLQPIHHRAVDTPAQHWFGRFYERPRAPSARSL
jgi:hypothetical protein